AVCAIIVNLLTYKKQPVSRLLINSCFLSGLSADHPQSETVTPDRNYPASDVHPQKFPFPRKSFSGILQFHLWSQCIPVPHPQTYLRLSGRVCRLRHAIPESRTHLPLWTNPNSAVWYA